MLTTLQWSSVRAECLATDGQPISGALLIHVAHSQCCVFGQINAYMSYFTMQHQYALCVCVCSSVCVCTSPDWLRSTRNCHPPLVSSCWGVINCCCRLSVESRWLAVAVTCGRLSVGWWWMWCTNVQFGFLNRSESCRKKPVRFALDAVCDTAYGTRNGRCSLVCYTCPLKA